jgi:hypothetical protein
MAKPTRPPRNWTRPCHLCGERFTSRSVGKYCSDDCRDAMGLVRGSRIMGPTRSDMPRLIRCQFCDVTLFDPVGRQCFCDEWCSEASRGRRRLECDLETGTCRRCGSVYCRDALAAAPGFCSMLCNRRHARSVRRAARRAIVVESFSLREIAERDGWCCHLCGRKVADRIDYAARDDDATLDHLVPVSKGGLHVRANVALAHNRCNWERGNADIEFQMRLIA